MADEDRAGKPALHHLSDGTSRFLGRYGSTNVPITAVGAVVYGALMLLGDASDYRAPVYDVAFSVFPRWAWGAAFVAAGVAALLLVRFVTVLALSGLIGTWSATLLYATSRDGVAPSAPAWSAVIAVSLLISVARRGIHPRRRR